MRVLLLLTLLWLGGCNAGYYWHLTQGHLSLMSARAPLEEVLDDAGLAARERQQLLLAGQVLAFAEQEAGLESGGSYRSYVSLDRDWVVWNLFAAPEFSLEPHRWCYPVAGCVSYRGHFDRERAEARARQLRRRGLDVYGGGAIAYSTLGWFDDPLTTPMLRIGEAELAQLLFHELVHQRLYVAGDTRFNESLATAVAEEVTRRWLAGREEAVAQEWRQRKQARARVVAWVRETREQLRQLYAADPGEGEMRRQKQDIGEQLRRRYRRAADGDPALEGWAGWFQGPLNNAQLNTLLDYNDFKPAFDRLMLACGGHWPCFWGQVERLAALEGPERERRLQTEIPRQRVEK